MHQNELQQLIHRTQKKLNRLAVQMRRTTDSDLWEGLAQMHMVMTHELAKAREALNEALHTNRGE
jgi:hypothetical protein